MSTIKLIELKPVPAGTKDEIAAELMFNAQAASLTSGTYGIAMRTDATTWEMSICQNGEEIAGFSRFRGTSLPDHLTQLPDCTIAVPATEDLRLLQRMLGAYHVVVEAQQ